MTRLPIITDLDGTLCDNRQRRMLIPPIKDLYDHWHEFNMACHGDTPIQYRIEMVRLLADSGHEIIYVTSRSECARQLTMHWLTRHGAPHGELVMRQKNDHRKSWEYKAEAIGMVLSQRQATKFAIIDDDSRICDHIAIRYPQAVVMNVPSVDCAYIESTYRDE